VTDASAPDPAAFAAAILEHEEQRHEEDGEEPVLPDDLLPGVGAEPMELRSAVAIGGTAMIGVLFAMSFVDELDATAMAVLAPDIQRSLHTSDAVLGAIAGATGILFVIGALPISALADRTRRTWIAAVSMAIWSVIVFATAFVRNTFQLFVARVGAGLGKSYVLPVHNPLLADTYPIAARGRVFAIHALANPMGQAAGPLIAGGVAALAGGAAGWRWAFVAIAIPGAVLAVVALTLREPRRGRNEQMAVLGHELAPEQTELPISTSVAFARLQKIKTFHYALIGVGALGFALFSIPLFLNLFLKDHEGLDALQRGIVNSLIVLPALVAIPIAGFTNDRLFRRHPSSSVLVTGALVAAFGIITVVGLYMPSIVLLVIVLGLGTALSRAGFAMLGPLIAAVVPYRLRSRGFALVGVYVFLLGAFLGGIITGALSDSLGERLALTIVVIPSTLCGGALIALGARHIREDISLVVEELEEEQQEAQRTQSPDHVAPVLQVRNLDFSYGSVQVLFDVALEVQRGELLALLGTNGAGKSTLLRVISGLGVPSRGVVRLNGRTMTYVSAESRVRLGVVQVQGGRAVFDPLTVNEHLKVAGQRLGRAELRRRVDHVLGLFPALADRLDETAGKLSGGQQQMLALATGLLHEPEILLIDELSLGLAPVAVQELLGTIETLKQAGQTMIIVEQSVNIALALADRAMFMEKGRVRFDGPAADLRDRDDLVRAVFLGEERQG
jgi:ABC-type branched-subunit amino acid transport system ATPase component/predicted MFS family arabinose efflux permease